MPAASQFMCDGVIRLLDALTSSAIAAGSTQRATTKRSHVGEGRAPGLRVKSMIGRLLMMVPASGSRSGKQYESSKFEETCLERAQCRGEDTAKFWQAGIAGEAGVFQDAVVGDGELQAHFCNMVGCLGGVSPREIVIFYGGQLGIDWAMSGYGMTEGFDGGQVFEHGVLEGCCWHGWLLGDPPDPGEGVCGQLGWFCELPGWRHGLRGVRVGEAAHPGPGGGAAATEHRRQENQMQQALVSIIELLMSVVASLAGSDHPVQKQMAGITGLLGVLRAGREDAILEEEQPPPPPWRQVTFQAEPDTTSFVTEGALKPIPGQKGGKAKAGGTIGQGKGKNLNLEEGNKNGSGSTGGKGGKDIGGKKGHVKGGKGGKRTGEDAKAKLRPQDWVGNIVDYATACSQLNSLSGSVLVWVKDEEQADALSQMLLGAGTKCTARMIWRSATGSFKVPVECAGELMVESFAFMDYTTTGTPLPSFKQAAKTAKKVPKEVVTTTLRVALAKDFVAKEVWKQATSAPRAAIQKWGREVAKAGSVAFVKDAWGFAEETRLGNAAVVGLIRVPVDRAAEVLQLSGEQGVFVEPAGRDNVVPCEIEWLDTVDGETWGQAVARAKAQKPKFGVFLGRRQVGMRLEAGSAPRASRIRYFAIKSAPTNWPDELVKEIVEEQTSLKQVVVHRKATQKGRATYYFKARAEEDNACYMLQVEDASVTSSLWVVPIRGEVVRSSRPISEKGGFVFQRRAPAQLGADKPEAKNSKGEDSKEEGPPAKKPAVARQQRAVPEGVAINKVDGDGNCFFSVVGQGLGRIRNEPALPPARVRAEICAHMRKHRANYEEFWNGKDSDGKDMQDFEDYIKHMAENGKWAGSLEAYAAAKTYKLAVYIIPAPVDMAAVAYNSTAKAKLGLWYTDKPGHFDWLCPPTGHELPETVTGMAEGTQPGDFPRGGAERQEEEGSEATVFTRIASRPNFDNDGGKTESVGRATVFTKLGAREFPGPITCKTGNSQDTRQSMAGGSTEEGATALRSSSKRARQTELEAAPSEATAFTEVAETKGKTLRHWFAQARRAGSEALTGVRSSASSSTMVVEDEDNASTEEIAPPPAPVAVRRWRGGVPRKTHNSWKCPECGWSTGRTIYWRQKKASHVSHFHPDLKAELSMRPQLIQMVPWSAATCVRRCPVENCGMGLPAVESSTDARLLARKHHAKTVHPDEPIQIFRLARRTADNARKATVARLGAGVAKRLNQIKVGAAGDHDVVCVKLPPLPVKEGKEGKQRKSRRAVTHVVCKCCKRIGFSPKELAVHPCKTTSPGSRRAAMLKRLREALDQGKLDADVEAGVTLVLNLFAEAATQPYQQHQPKAMAWPLDAKTWEARFVCPRCSGVWKRLRDVEGKQCMPERKRARYAEAAQLSKLSEVGGAVGEAATNILGFLKVKGAKVADEDETRQELARGLGGHA